MPTICSSESGTDTHWLSTRVYTHLLGSQKIKRLDFVYNHGSQKYLKILKEWAKELSVLGQFFHENH
jgi:hypothetical protein